MLARPDYLIPLVAAERQFRDHYYGLNSAALLEDLFFDALGNFLRQTEPATQLSRPPTGQKGWDYAFDGLTISHKVSQRVGDIAALWDATKKGVTSWSFDEPITYVLGSNSPSTSLNLTLDDQSVVRCRSAADLGRPYIADGRTLLVIEWPSDGRSPRLLDAFPTGQGQKISDALPFSALWSIVAGHIRDGGAANDIELVVTTKKKLPRELSRSIEANLLHEVSAGVDYRGGVYLLPRERLQDLEVKSNNRAILIPRAVVSTLLDASMLEGLFAPMPLWYWVYAEERPPDMYSAQRAEYDARFSARGELDL